MILSLSLLLALSAQSKNEYPFQVDEPVEVVADLEMSAPGADWGRSGRESAMATVTLDGAEQQQHVMLFAGNDHHHYRVLLGELKPGAHQIRVERHPDYSARGINLDAF